MWRLSLSPLQNFDGKAWCWAPTLDLINPIEYNEIVNDFLCGADKNSPIKYKILAFSHAELPAVLKCALLNLKIYNDCMLEGAHIFVGPKYQRENTPKYII